jgi:hypothetical protein
MTPENNPVVHLFSPEVHHDKQGIIGNREGLKALLQVIQKAIEDDKTDAKFFASDGEGFTLFVKCVPKSRENKMALPYTEDYCKEDREDAIYPWGPGR